MSSFIWRWRMKTRSESMQCLHAHEKDLLLKRGCLNCKAALTTSHLDIIRPDSIEVIGYPGRQNSAIMPDSGAGVEWMRAVGLGHHLAAGAPATLLCIDASGISPEPSVSYPAATCKRGGECRGVNL